MRLWKAATENLAREGEESRGRVRHLLVALVVQGVSRAGHGKVHAATGAVTVAPDSGLASKTYQAEEGWALQAVHRRGGYS